LFDGSHLSLEQNIESTREIQKFAEKHNVMLEAEVNGIPGIEDDHEKTSSGMCKVNVLLDFIEKTGVNLIAPYFGNKHGIYGDGYQSFDLQYVRELKKLSPVPLVIHGGSGMPDNIISELNDTGFAKINYSTDFKNLLCPDNVISDPFKANNEIEKNVIEHTISLFNKHRAK
jgi:fructose/tagatose bisphosphate aldolase